MEELFFAIFEVLGDLLWSSTVDNPRTKRWVKVLVVSLIFGVLIAFAIGFCIEALLENSLVFAIICGMAATGLAGYLVCRIIRILKKG